MEIGEKTDDHKKCDSCGTTFSVKQSNEGACPSCGYRGQGAKKVPEMLYRRQDPEGAGPDKGPIGGVIKGAVPMGLMNKRALEKSLTDLEMDNSFENFAVLHKAVTDRADDGFGVGKLTAGPSDGFDMTDTIGFQTKAFAEKLKANAKSVFSFKENATKASSSAKAAPAKSKKTEATADQHNQANANLFEGKYSKGSLEEHQPKGAAQGFGSTGGPNPALMNQSGGNSMN